MRRQIAHLAEGTRKAALEELAGDIPVTSRDELGELAESFNAMIRALGKRPGCSRKSGIGWRPTPISCR